MDSFDYFFLSLTIHPYKLLLLENPLYSTLYSPRTDESTFLLVELLRSLSETWENYENYETHYPLSFVLNSITTVLLGE